ncbi:MAG: energy transducer TonB [Crocinitomicaceae bacterium]|nr:energy transducer TonB [Crocinitomicaceae bacterium]
MKILLAISVLFVSGYLLSQKDTISCGGEIDSLSGLCVYKIVDEMPEYPGGFAEMMSYFLKVNISTTKESIHYFGKIYLGFIVTKDGSITGIRLIKGEKHELNRPYLEAVSKMPKWKPGKLNGKNVNTLFILPVQIHFQ